MASHDHGYYEDGDDSYDGEYDDWAQVSGSDATPSCTDEGEGSGDETGDYSDHNYDVSGDGGEDEYPSGVGTGFTSPALDAADALQASYDGERGSACGWQAVFASLHHPLVARLLKSLHCMPF